MAKDSLEAAKEFSEYLRRRGFLLFPTEAQKELARSLIERAFVQGASWGIDAIEEAQK